VSLGGGSQEKGSRRERKPDEKKERVGVVTPFITCRGGEKKKRAFNDRGHKSLNLGLGKEEELSIRWRKRGKKKDEG